MMHVTNGERHSSQDFLAVYSAFKGALTAGDLAIGQQWFKVWQAAQQSIRDAVAISAAVERRHGRVEVADALEAAVAQSSIEATTSTHY